MCSVLSFLTSPHTPSQLKQLRQQLATTQRLLDSYDTRGTAGDLRELAATATHGGGCGRSRGRGDFVTYGRSRPRPSAAARGAGTSAAASVSAAAGSRAGIYVGIDYEST